MVCLLACHHETRLNVVDLEQITADLPRGISDIAIDERGHLWTLAERERVVAEIEIAGSLPAAPVVVRHALDGVPDGVDTEAIAYLGDGQFAIGTEGHDQPSASVLFGQVGSDGHMVLRPGFSITSEMLGVELRKNHGVEALCGNKSVLAVGIETVGVLHGRRYAPIVRVSGDSQVVQRLLLTTANGKLSALSCTVAANGTLDLIAIERDYGVTRLLRARARSDQLEIQPKVLVDLWPMIRKRFDEKLNLEGIVRLRDGRVVVVNDGRAP